MSSSSALTSGSRLITTQHIASVVPSESMLGFVNTITLYLCYTRNFGFYLPDTDTDRPGLGAWCTSWARPGTHAALTRYNTNGGSTLIDTTLGTAEGWMVQATAFDGTIATAVPTSAASSTTSSSSSISRSSSSISTPMSTITTTSSSTTSITHATTTSSWTGQTDYGALPTCGVSTYSLLARTGTIR